MIKATKWYVRITKPDHPRADSNGTVRRSVLIMEAHLGRLLLPEEEVHHINGIIMDDRIKNLELLTRKEHQCKYNNLENCNHTRSVKGHPFWGNQYRRLTEKVV